eukprot:280105_1
MPPFNVRYLPHLNIYHNLGLIKDALRHKKRSIYVHNTPEIRDVLGQLQKYGYIGRFIAVHEPFKPRESKRVAAQTKKSPQLKEHPPYFLVFLKYRMSNKHLGVLGGIYYAKRPTRMEIPYPTMRMKVPNQGVGMEFARISEKNATHKEWMPTHLAKLRGINGYKGFKVWS